MKLLIAGDFFISEDYTKDFRFNDSILSLFHEADYRILNLEAPITNVGGKSKILKTGPYLKTSSDFTISLLRQLKIDLVTIANNHILDFGETGLSETITNLRNNGIAFVGAGMDISEASKPFMLIPRNTKIAILNFAENEWSIARDNKPGANPLDPIDNFKQITEAKKQADIVIVIIHGGHEHYEFPSPGMVKQYRFYAESGASLIVGHHSHCINGYEVHRGVPIFYGLGNFLFTLPSTFDGNYTGMILQIELANGSPAEWHLIPVRQNPGDFAIDILENNEKETVLKKLSTLNSIIEDEEQLKNVWLDFLARKRNMYYQIFSPIHNIPFRYIRSALFRVGINRIFFSKRYLKYVLNAIRCESHHHALKDLFENDLEK